MLENLFVRYTILGAIFFQNHTIFLFFAYTALLQLLILYNFFLQKIKRKSQKSNVKKSV